MNPIVLTCRHSGSFDDKFVSIEESSVAFNWRVGRSLFLDRMSRLPGVSSLVKAKTRARLIRYAVDVVSIASKKFSVVVASCPSAEAVLIGEAISKKFNLPFVVDYRDPWSYCPRPAFPHWIDFHVEYKREKKLLVGVDLVICTTNSHAEFIASEFKVEPERIQVIPNGFEPSDFEGSNLPSGVEFEPGIFNIVHTGDLANVKESTFGERLFKKCGFQFDPLDTDFGSRSPIHFMSGLERLLERRPELIENVRVWFVGIPRESIHRGIVGFRHPEVVNVIDRVSENEAAALMKSADLLLLLQNSTFLDGKSISLQIAAKTYSYLYSGKRVLAGVRESENAQLIKDYAAGKIVDPTDASGFERVLEEEFDNWAVNGCSTSSSREIFGFSRRQLAFGYSQLLKSIAT